MLSEDRVLSEDIEKIRRREGSLYNFLLDVTQNVKNRHET